MAIKLELTRTLSGSPDRVFEIWLDAQSMYQWMRPGDTIVADVEINPLVGNTFRIDMQTPDGSILRHMGEYGVIESPTMLKFTWQSSATDNRITLVTITFKPHAEGCELTLVHDLLLSEPMVNAHQGGWADILEQLAELL